MSKAVLISIHPKWVRLIMSGEKTLEVRKNCPKLETPFKCYIYETQGRKWQNKNEPKMQEGRGAVIGYFCCDYITTVSVPYPAYMNEMRTSVLKESCLSYYDIHRYAGTRNVYGWHISNLLIYDTPRPLNDFKRWDRTEENAPCAHVYSLYAPCDTCKECNLKRPPQSYCFVEDLP